MYQVKMEKKISEPVEAETKVSVRVSARNIGWTKIANMWLTTIL